MEVDSEGSTYTFKANVEVIVRAKTKGEAARKLGLVFLTSAVAVHGHKITDFELVEE